MFDQGNQNSQTDEAQNAPMLAFYATPMLGNTWFQMQVPGKTEVKTGFPQIPYVAPEAELYFSSMMNPLTSPTSIVGGSNTGQQVIAGQQTFQDTTGTARVLQGTQLSQGIA